LLLRELGRRFSARGRPSTCLEINLEGPWRPSLAKAPRAFEFDRRSSIASESASIDRPLRFSLSLSLSLSLSFGRFQTAGRRLNKTRRVERVGFDRRELIGDGSNIDDELWDWRYGMASTSAARKCRREGAMPPTRASHWSTKTTPDPPFARSSRMRESLVARSSEPCSLLTSCSFRDTIRPRFPKQPAGLLLFLIRAGGGRGGEGRGGKRARYHADLARESAFLEIPMELRLRSRLGWQFSLITARS